MKGGMRLRASPMGAGEKLVGLEMEQLVWGRAGCTTWLLAGDERVRLQAVLHSCTACSVTPSPSSCLQYYATTNNQSSNLPWQTSKMFLGASGELLLTLVDDASCNTRAYICIL